MKKLLGLLAVAPMSLAACGGSDAGAMDFWNDDYTTTYDNASGDAAKAKEIEKSFGHEGVTYVDIRDLSDKAGGYLEGFEFVSFFNFLEDADTVADSFTNGGIVKRDVDTDSGNKTWTYTHGTTEVNSNFAVTQYFGAKDAKLVLFCASGTRAAFMRDVLTEAFGYDEKLVLNAGGWGDKDNFSDEWIVEVA